MKITTETLRAVCCKCDKLATAESYSRFYCAAHDPKAPKPAGQPRVLKLEQALERAAERLEAECGHGTLGGELAGEIRRLLAEQAAP